jgi:hypothetical protein
VVVLLRSTKLALWKSVLVVVEAAVDTAAETTEVATVAAVVETAAATVGKPDF